MKQFAVDPQSNTFLFTNGKMRFTENNLEYMAQKIRGVISLYLGEWFLDITLGIPYFPQSDNKIEHRALLETALRTKIASVKGVKRVTNFASTLDMKTRIISVSFSAETNSGELVEADGWNIGV